MPSTTVAAEVHAKPSRRPPCGLPCALLLRAAASTGHQPTEGARVRAGPATKARGRKKADARPERGLARGSRLVSHPHPLLLLLFQTEHARGDGTCARRGAYSAAKPGRERAARDSAVSSARSSAGMSRISALSLVCVCVAARAPSRDARRARAPCACAPRRPGRARALAAPPRSRGAARGAGAHPPSSSARGWAGFEEQVEIWKRLRREGAAWPRWTLSSASS